MNQAIADCVKFVFDNELPPSFAPLAARLGRAPLRIALGDLLNWLKGMAEGFSEPQLRLASPTIRRVLRSAVTEIGGLADLFELKRERLLFRRNVLGEQRTEIAAYVRDNSRFPEDVLVRHTT
jgi:hypothetical protein